jgi:hypothetical protein
MGLQACEIVLDREIAAPDDRGVTHIDDLQDAIAGHRPARARKRLGWQGPALAPSGSPVTRH